MNLEPVELGELMETPVLETERLILRAPRTADYPAWEAFIGDDRARFVGGPLAGGRAWRTFATLMGHWLIRGCGGFVLVERQSGRPIGHVGPWYPGDWPEREIGWCAWTPAAEGRGLVREAAETVLTHVFRDLGWSTAVSYIDPANARSIALAERLGAVRDPDAVLPPDVDVLAYRHPRPEAA